MWLIALPLVVLRLVALCLIALLMVVLWLVSLRLVGWGWGLFPLVTGGGLSDAGYLDLGAWCFLLVGVPWACLACWGDMEAGLLTDLIRIAGTGFPQAGVDGVRIRELRTADFVGFLRRGCHPRGQ